MERGPELAALVLAVVGLALVGVGRLFVPRFEDLDILRVVALLTSVAIMSVGGYWLVARSRSDPLPGAVLAGRGAVGLAVLALGGSGRRRRLDA